MFTPREELPDQCPPSEAIALDGKYVRLVEGPEVAADFFCSFNAQGHPPRKKVDPCIWAGCSLVHYDESWTAGPLERVKDFARSALLLKHKRYAAVLKISPSDGLAHRGNPDSPHVTFWMHKDFDPLTAIVEVVEL